ncbi:protein-L-isoaspartate O-methyltransferase [Salinirubellus salinus]|uniref:protein-L-isoaspartate(D-aspartate) O-methyltransferase n=1 Tax=Salinirubellus salinus TaxID=1364945 RepID=A0A9E7R2R5_9EURY|nr:protein-L-isoaspartate O-methyltransferase [Salinirubellus salinus]UWM54189.1 protein-L-isoaspartate O-methyltransferase [Salinirubellus salinus]
MDPAVLRDDMVDSLEHEAKRCIRSATVSVAMREVPREAFVGDEYAYADRTGECHGTRVLAPSTAARLLEALAPDPDDNVLVVGVGVGYTAAVLAEIVGAANVQAVDIDRRLVYEARSNLERAGYGAVLVDCADGADGLPAYAPYDRVLVEAAAIEPPARLVRQLASDGRLVLPLGGGEQTLSVVERGDGSGEVVERLGTTAFSPMLVDGEQANTVERNRTHREDREFAQRAHERRKGWEQDWIDWDRY